MATLAESLTRSGASERASRFHVRMAITFIAVAVVGFLPTYWLPMGRGTLAADPIVHLHAVVFFGWTLLFLAQTLLVASGNVRQHRALGVVGVSWATAMIFVGLLTAIHSVKTSTALGFGPGARAFATIPVTGIALFAATVTVALVNVRDRELHRRLMILATVPLLQAPVGRWFQLFLKPPDAPVGARPPVESSFGAAIAVDLLIVVAMVHDRRTRGRVHPVYWIGGAVVLAVQLLRLPISRTSAWGHVLDGLMKLVP